MDTKQQIQNWSKLYDKPISETEYKEICQNLGGFFEILKQWSNNEKRELNVNGENRKDEEFLSNERP